MFHFTGEIVGGTLQLEEHVITDSKWVKPSDLLVPGFLELREAKLMSQIAANLVHAKLHSLAVFNAQLEK
ncbi:hypothetical protein ACHHV8_16100 [Paenibacillus sp. TAB 01]|uniref:hypothetical protein n=1 Tax=Paenibacillus sp. TAB 01 TaxID=3368988 RepID=UPI003750D2EE